MMSTHAIQFLTACVLLEFGVSGGMHVDILHHGLESDYQFETKLGSKARVNEDNMETVNRNLKQKFETLVKQTENNNKHNRINYSRQGYYVNHPIRKPFSNSKTESGMHVGFTGNYHNSKIPRRYIKRKLKYKYGRFNQKTRHVPVTNRADMDYNRFSGLIGKYQTKFISTVDTNKVSPQKLRHLGISNPAREYPHEKNASRPNHFTAKTYIKTKPSLSSNVNNDICDQFDVNGCSVPFGAPFFYKTLFTKSCNRHDVCYHCGVGYGINRKTCDHAFKDNMWNACIGQYGDGSDVTSTKHKRLIISLVKGLDGQFKNILRQELRPMMRATGNNKKDLELFLKHAQFVQRKVLKQWLSLLRHQIMVKKKKFYPRTGQLLDLKRKNELLQYKKDTRNDDLMYDINLTTNLCEEVLENKNPTSGVIGLSCNEVNLLSCGFFDNVYFLAVRIFGSPSYHSTPEFYCGESFVPQCLPSTLR